MSDDAILWAIEELAKLHADGVPEKRKRLEVAEEALKEFFRANPNIQQLTTPHGLVTRDDGSRKQLDTQAVKLFLADELHKFQKQIATVGIKFTPAAPASAVQ